MGYMEGDVEAFRGGAGGAWPGSQVGNLGSRIEVIRQLLPYMDMGSQALKSET